jgi:hypothetical protein
MDIHVITLPEGKTVGLDGNRYKLAESVDVPASALGEPLKKQATKMRPLVCTVCFFKARATKKYKDRVIVCAGTEATPHDPTFLTWLDDAEDVVEEGE